MEVIVFDSLPAVKIFCSGVMFGFAASLFSGLLSWCISAICRLYKNIISGGR